MSKPKKLRVLVGCELSGAVRRAFRELGHDAWSCDLEPSDDGSPYHYQCDILSPGLLQDKWDLAIFHPPCTFLSVSGIHWNDRGRGWAGTLSALEFVRQLLDAPIPRIALENPVSVISRYVRKPDQIIQPYQFGHDASKRTCLWLKNLPHLVPTSHIPPRLVGNKPRWGNQTDGGQNKLPPSKLRAKLRAETYSGIAEAMARQWGGDAR